MTSTKLIFSIVGIIILLGLIGTVLLYKNIIQKSQVAGLDTQATPQIPTSEELAQQILYSSNPEGNYEIYQMSLKDKKPVNLTQNSADDMNPQLSPDGDLIVFYSNRSGSNQIYQMSLETKAVKQLTNSPANDYDPSFSPDGSKIVFKSTRDDKLGDIFVMDSDGSNEENLTRKRTKTEEWDPTFSADGSKIIFVVRSGSDDASRQAGRSPGLWQCSTLLAPECASPSADIRGRPGAAPFPWRPAIALDPQHVPARSAR